MSNGNNEPKKQEGQIKQRCPFNNERCGDWCPRYVTIFKVVMGQRRTAGMCVDVANNIMLSEINQKTQPKQQEQKIQLPNMRG